MNIILYTAAVVFTTSFLVNASNPWHGCPQDKDSDPDCPDGWFSFETNCYTFFTQTPLSYMEGRLNCQRHGGLLLRIDSMAQHDFIAQKLEGFAVTRTMRWYTSGVMRPDSFGEFMWEGYPLIYQQVKTELLSLWIDQIPKPQDRSTFPANRTRIVYGSDGNRWGWYLDTATPQRNYVCQASKAIANQLLPTAKSLTYGTPVTLEPLRGPCFLSNPLDVLYVRKLSIEKYAELKCEANGNPQPTYNWYIVSTESRTDSSGRTTTWINRTLINPTADNQGRISISAGSLVIHSPDSATDSQLFQCEAKNSQGSILSRTVRIVFGQLETPQKQPRNERRVLAHKSETLPCDPPAHSPPDSKLANLYLLDTGTYVCMITMQFNGVRLFDSPKLPDMPFTVMHSNEPRQEPRIYDEFPAVWPSNPQRGQMVRLECFASGYSQVEGLKYSWRRLDGVPLRTNSLKDFNRVIEMPNIQPEDQGEYECSVEDSYGKKAKPKSLNLRITAKPFFTTPIHDTVVDFGATVLMTCEASAIPSPQHQWFRNGVDLSDLIARRVLDPTRYSINQTSDTRSTLRITNAQLTDNAMLTCLAWNSLGSESSCAELRVVQLAPTFAKHPVMPNEGMVGGTAVMECQPEGAPGMNTSWFHGTTALSPGTSTLDPETGTATCASQYCTLPNGNLLIVRLVDANAGEYTCVAKNALGEARSSAYLTVIPALQLSLKPVNRVVYQNSTVLLPCRAKSSPVLDVNYAWFFEGVEIKFDRLDLDARRYEVAQLLRPYGRYFGQLYITNVQFENSGNYSCAAETPLSTLASNALIQVAGPPGPCGGVIVDPQVGVNQVNVTWTVGNSHLFQITSFVIEANAFLDPRDKWTVVVSNLNINETQQLLPSGRRMTFVRNLAANMAYRLRIRAVNQAGPGEPSLPSLFFTTLPTAPTKMPLNVTGGGGKHGTLVFQWVPLSRVDENGPNFRYRAHIRAKGDNEYGTYELWTMKSIEGGKFLQYTHMLGDNLYYKPYEVRLEAVNSKVTVCASTRSKFSINSFFHGLLFIKYKIFNSAGDGPESSFTEQTTFKISPQDFPTMVTLNATDQPSTIRVSWVGIQARPNEESVEGYRIRFWPAGSQFKQTFTDVDVGLKTYGFVTGLEPDMRYNLRVYGYSRGGVGKMSSPVNQFQIIPKNKCVPGATWDGPDFRYNFICQGCLARAELLVPCIAIFAVWLLSSHM
ncbi:Septate junction protein [Fasciola gigantica]|uniref:Septate junction protein n=1 Tax=Fasciola gigantica TaxID=46835 RepID=A0A504YCX4_FASGI|nr:Septate junction protein [Fasciola gigantica]